MEHLPRWQLDLDPSFLVNQNRLVSDLYECCLQLFLYFVKRPVPGLEPSIQRRLHTQAQKFKLWGVSFNVPEGELDQKLIGANGLRNALLPILSGMGETLVTLARRLRKVEELPGTCLHFHMLQCVVSEVTTRSSPDNDDTFPQVSLDELSSLESGDLGVDEMADLEDLIRDTESYNACLFGLGPALEDPAEKAIPGFDASQSLKSVSFVPPTHSAMSDSKQAIESSDAAIPQQYKGPTERSKYTKNLNLDKVPVAFYKSNDTVYLRSVLGVDPKPYKIDKVLNDGRYKLKRDDKSDGKVYREKELQMVP